MAAVNTIRANCRKVSTPAPKHHHCQLKTKSLIKAGR